MPATLYLSDRILFFTRQPGRIQADLPLEFKGGRRFKKKGEIYELPPIEPWSSIFLP
jgi:NitT/TauT family transport system ATP-binding protein